LWAHPAARTAELLASREVLALDVEDGTAFSSANQLSREISIKR
jgi:hypothetical protein